MDVWHKRFGHVSPKTVKFIFDNDAVTGMQVKGKENPHTPECKCPQCMQLKAKRVHIGDYRPDREHHATQVGETLHCDLHGPMPTSITTGASYYMSVIDEASGWHATSTKASPIVGDAGVLSLTWPPKGHEKGHKKDKAKAKQNFWLWHRGVKDLTLLMRGKTPAGLNK